MKISIKSNKHVEPYMLVGVVAHCIDQIDSNECAPDTVATAVASVLMELGYPELESYASTSQNMAPIQSVFGQAYWESRLVSHKVSTLMAAVKVAAESIEERKIDVKIKNATREAIAKDRQDSKS